jgi:ParB family chromosome partitioning protein
MKKRGLGSGLGGLLTVEPVGERGLREVPLAAIVPNPHQPRLRFEPTALQELADSIREHGVLQPPVAMQLPNGDYQLIAGERRVRAATLAGLQTIPVVVKDVSPQAQLELALIENIQRADLDPIEEARAYAALEEQFHMTHSEIARRVGKSRSTVTELLGLLRLPEEVQELVSAKQLTTGHASRLVALRDPQKQIKAAEHIVQHGMSVRAAEGYVANLHNPPPLVASPAKSVAQQPSILPVSRADDQALEQELESLLGGMRVQLMRTAESDKRGRLVIHFDNEEMLQHILERLGTH